MTMYARDNGDGTTTYSGKFGYGYTEDNATGKSVVTCKECFGAGRVLWILTCPCCNGRGKVLC